MNTTPQPIETALTDGSGKNSAETRMNLFMPDYTALIRVIPQPIDTAPTDGRYLLLFDINEWVIGRYSYYQHIPSCWESLEEQAVLHPTHWSPLPPNP